MLKVPGHLCGQHHVNNGLSQRSELVPVTDKVEAVETSLHPRADRKKRAGAAVADLSVFLKMLLLPSRMVSWKARAAWWLSSTAVSLYRMASSLPALHRKELVLPGWSTSCTVAAIRAATSSSWSRLL